eukprot:scaffold4066_cov417-Prasinococcus_capsulatus_cf.AAC.1
MLPAQSPSCPLLARTSSDTQKSPPPVLKTLASAENDAVTKVLGPEVRWSPAWNWLASTPSFCIPLADSHTDKERSKVVRGISSGSLGSAAYRSFSSKVTVSPRATWACSTTHFARGAPASRTIAEGAGGPAWAKATAPPAPELILPPPANWPRRRRPHCKPLTGCRQGPSQERRSA